MQERTSMATDRQPRFGRSALAALAALAVAAAALCGCGTQNQRISAPPRDNPPVSADTDVPVAGVAGAALRASIPGLYVPDSISASPLPSGAFDVRTALGCAAVRSVLLAGDWQRLQELVVPATLASALEIGGLSPTLLLGQGSDVVAAKLIDRPDGCHGTIIPATTDATTTIDVGAGASDGAGWAVTLRCIQSADDLTVDAIVGVPDANAVVHVRVDGAGPERPASLDGSVDSLLVTGPLGAFDLLTTGLAAPDGSPMLPEGSAFMKLDGDDITGRAVVDESAPTPRGTIEIAGLRSYDQAAGRSGTAGLSFGFTCGDVTTLG
jgi:hypothetical protein